MHTRFCQTLLPLCVLAAIMTSIPAFSETCVPPQIAKVATSKEIHSFVKSKRLKVLTFTGYSAAAYEDEAAMLAKAKQLLERHDPGKTLVNIGATAAGVGVIYHLAKQTGFHTMGIVSSLARDEKAQLSPCVDDVFFIRDSSWGGYLPGTKKLAPTSAAMVSVSSEIVGIGGGEVSRDEMLAARKAGKHVEFFPADMNHRIAREKAANKGLPEPTDFRGVADAALGNIP
jgi:hypothetical protein